MYTPWGSSQHQKKVTEGIVFYDTASHGGYKLSNEKINEMPAELKNIKPWAGAGWYEEDCDWSIVVLSFPEFFTIEQIKGALLTAKNTGYLKAPVEKFFFSIRGFETLQKRLK